MYYTDDLDTEWTQYSGNPILSAATAQFRWPSVALVDGTLHMFLTNRVDKEIQRWTSTDGINFTEQEYVFKSLEADDQYFNPFIWLNPKDSKWYLYFKEHKSTIRYLFSKNASDITGLAAITPTLVAGGNSGDPLEITAAPSVMYKYPFYYLSTEGYPDPGYWATYTFYSKDPNFNFYRTATNPILGTATDGQACAIQLLSPDSKAIYLYSSRETASEWYIDVKKARIG